jgi:2-keto-4-pentenoate hydratase/2-oxohepta-3-ene-1,7-dioic acid hydratase in catechol pathway
MRLVSFRPSGEVPRVGVLSGDRIIALDRSLYPDMTSFLSAESTAQAEVEKISRRESPAKYLLSDVVLLAPVTCPGKIIAVGLNYRDHAIGPSRRSRQY